ncbi:MAG: hypothetical protein ABFR75_05125 [Acidobacteriota bacterium]
MKKRIIFFIFLFSLILNIALVVNIISSEKGKSPERSLFSEKINLSDDQKKKIDDESFFLKEENKKLELKLSECRKELYTVLDSDIVDKTRVEKCIDDINRIQKKIQMNTIDHLLIYKKHLSKKQCDCFLADFGEQMDVEHKCEKNCK